MGSAATRIRFGLALAAMALLALSAPSAAQEGRPRGVVELFTSQGCSSCPRADAYMRQLAESDDVIALSYHVDYWDYLGWRDTLASPENTARQTEYGRQFGLRSVYTPQAVVNGRMHANGARRQIVESALDTMTMSGEGLNVDISIVTGADSVVIEVGAKPANLAKAKANVLLVFFDPSTTVDITRGENAGRTITYRNAVTGFQSAGMWHGGKARFEIPSSEITKKGRGGCAVLLQSMDEKGMTGAILGAAMIADAVY